MSQIQHHALTIEITKKKIKNLHLKILPPHGDIHISAPMRMNLDTIKSFITSKLDWIHKQQKKLQARKQALPQEYANHETHYLWGKPYILEINHTENKKHYRVEKIHHDTAISVGACAPSPPVNAYSQEEAKTQVPVSIGESAPVLPKILLFIHSDADKAQKQKVLDAYYRSELNNILPALMTKWESIIGVKSSEFCIQKMKTRWGTCNIRTKKIRFNLELAKKSLDCLEYVVAHELIHLLEASHNRRFWGFMDQYMPTWRVHRKALKNHD